MPHPGQPKPTLALQARLALPGLSPAERKLIRLILSTEPSPPLDRVADLADFAGVSAPTVLRTLTKLGFENYSDFRKRAVSELSKKQTSALAQMRERPPLTKSNFVEEMSTQYCALMQDALQSPDREEILRAVDFLSDKSRKQVCAGGRFSQGAAEQLYLHSQLLRPGCRLLPPGPRQRMEQSIDFGRAHVLTVFDFRRYQPDTIELAIEAKRRRAKIILITDPWMSPIADIADVVLVVGVQCASPFDSLVPAFALTETLISGMYSRLQKTAEARLSQFEELDAAHLVGGIQSHIRTEETE